MEDGKIICPLLSIGESDYLACAKEKCAWWSEKHQKCAVAVEPPKK